MKEKPKVRRRDVETTVTSVLTEVYKVGNTLYRTDRQTLDGLITHEDCSRCGVEFKKRFTYDKMCAACTEMVAEEKYFTFEEVEWDGKTMIYSEKEDEYFHSIDEVEEYAEDNGFELVSLRLLATEETNPPQIDMYDLYNDMTHEGWEPSRELEEKVREFNEFLRSERTYTYFPIKKRIKLL